MNSVVRHPLFVALLLLCGLFAAVEVSNSTIRANSGGGALSTVGTIIGPLGSAAWIGGHALPASTLLSTSTLLPAKILLAVDPAMALTITAILAGAAILFLLGMSVNVWRMFRSLPLSAMTPGLSDVQTALDALPEGVVLLGPDHEILTVNRVFAQLVMRPTRELIGRSLSELPWRGESARPVELPWQRFAEDASLTTAVLLRLPVEGYEPRVFRVSCALWSDASDQTSRVVVSFADVTNFEQSQSELRELLHSMRESTAEVRRENRRLERLATRDPLTSCYNRRSFHEHFESHWKTARRHNLSLACILIDIDHFKVINDTHGHPTGDEVLCQFAELVRKSARDCDVICRYGGEEFAVLLPHTDLAEAKEAAERLRQRIEASRFAELQVTASFGVSELSLGASTPEMLIDQADRCLLAAKRSGRNRVVCWADLPNHPVTADEPVARRELRPDTSGMLTLPFAAVNALVTVLAFRDADTAEHSRRVADLCLLASARRRMSHPERHTLEVAALLHDIGKIGVPDSILLKPGPLSDSEYAELRKHQRIGVEIIKTAFGTPELSDIVSKHHLDYSPSTKLPPGMEPPPSGEELPLGARILCIANAYDAMVSDRVFRAGMSREDAFAELRRCAGQQFDPRLVEEFIAVVEDASQTREGRENTQSRQLALDVGQQVERLLAAIEDRDVSGIHALSGRLSDLAQRYGMLEIAEKANSLHSCSTDDAAFDAVLQTTQELIAECRSAQVQADEAQPVS